jgi:hypothetical protein
MRTNNLDQLTSVYYHNHLPSSSNNTISSSTTTTISSPSASSLNSCATFNKKTTSKCGSGPPFYTALVNYDKANDSTLTRLSQQFNLVQTDLPLDLRSSGGDDVNNARTLSNVDNHTVSHFQTPNSFLFNDDDVNIVTASSSNESNSQIMMNTSPGGVGPYGMKGGPGLTDPLLARQKHHHRKAFEFISKALRIDEESTG